VKKKKKAGYAGRPRRRTTQEDHANAPFSSYPVLLSFLFSLHTSPPFSSPPFPFRHLRNWTSRLDHANALFSSDPVLLLLLFPLHTSPPFSSSPFPFRHLGNWTSRLAKDALDENNHQRQGHVLKSNSGISSRPSGTCKTRMDLPTQVITHACCGNYSCLLRNNSTEPVNFTKIDISIPLFH
jgi:hypothetical protein